MFATLSPPETHFGTSLSSTGYLAERGFKSEVSPHLTIFRQAYAFMNTAALLYEKVSGSPPDASAMGSFVVNATFALELYFKTIAIKHGTTLRGHELVRLLKNLPAAAKREIERQLVELSKTSQWACGVDTMEGLRKVVAELNTAFVD